jgi:hypothetical protein
MFPLCAECQRQGITKLTDEIDHIIPLTEGGEDVDGNCQGLCFDHHAEKSAREGNIHAAANHPEWLRPSSIPLTIVSGPPASGKTTYVNASADAYDTIICLDTILTELKPTYQHWTRSLDPTLLNRAIRLRNARLSNLAHARSGRAWFIVSAPTQGERDWWQGKLGGEVILLHPGVEECKRRAIARGTPQAVEGIQDWERKSRRPWKATTRTQTTAEWLAG